MSLPTRRPTYHYRMRSDLVGRTLRTFADWLKRSRFFWYGLTIGALWVTAMTMDFNDQLAEQRDNAVQAAERIANWHKGKWARVTIEGEPAQVSNLANQVAASVR